MTSLIGPLHIGHASLTSLAQGAQRQQCLQGRITWLRGSSMQTTHAMTASLLLLLLLLILLGLGRSSSSGLTARVARCSGVGVYTGDASFP